MGGITIRFLKVMPRIVVDSKSLGKGVVNSDDTVALEACAEEGASSFNCPGFEGYLSLQGKIAAKIGMELLVKTTKSE